MDVFSFSEFVLVCSNLSPFPSLPPPHLPSPLFLSLFLKKTQAEMSLLRDDPSHSLISYENYLCFQFSQFLFESSTTTPNFLATRANHEPVKYQLLGIIPKFELFFNVGNFPSCLLLQRFFVHVNRLGRWSKKP